MNSKFVTSALASGLLVTGLFVAGIAGTARPAEAQVTLPLYSDISNFLGQGFVIGGATSTTVGTAMALDDIQEANFPLGAVTSMTFSVANFNTVAVNAEPVISIYNGTAAGPTTLIQSFTFNPITFSAGPAVGTFTFAPGGTIFTTSTSGFFWAGTSFTDGTTGTATLAQLNNLGVGIFNPPTVGSSQNSFFLTTSPGVSTTNNPAGNLTNFGGSPVANFGFAFTGLSSAPEPTSVALALSAAGMLGGIAIRRRRAGA